MRQQEHQDDWNQRRRCRYHPGSRDAEPRPARGDAGLREERVADGDVLVDGQHEQREGATDERQQQGNQQDENDEEAVPQTGDLEMREDVRGVVVHPDEDGAERVAYGQVDQEDVVDGARTSDVHHRQQGQDVEEQAADGQRRVRDESDGVLIGVSGHFRFVRDAVVEHERRILRVDREMSEQVVEGDVVAEQRHRAPSLPGPCRHCSS